MKKIITIVLIIAAIGLVAFTLSNNKEKMAEKAALAERVSDRIPVQLGTVIRKKMDSKISAIGNFEAKTDLTMLSEIEGLIIKKYHEKGDFVNKGELLAQVENESLQAGMEAAEASRDKAQVDLERFSTLAKKDAVTQRQLEDMRINSANTGAAYKKAKKAYEDSFIRATATGMINEDYFQEGSNITKNAKLYDIVDVSILKLDVKLTASNIVEVHEGDSVRITTEMYPDKKYTGIITAIANKADKSLKYGVELRLKNSKDEPLRAGMFGTAHFEFQHPADALYINRDALAGSIKDPTVFVAQDSIAVVRTISIGETYDTEVQVLDGLKEGDKVVVNGQINLKDSTRIRDIAKAAKADTSVAIVQ